jgi:hypothetical protein
VIFLPDTWINMDAARVYEEMVQVRGGRMGITLLRIDFDPTDLR